MPITKVKNELTKLVREIEDGAEVTITKESIPAAVIISWEEFKKLKRQEAALRIREFRNRLSGSDIDAETIHHESRKELERRT